MRLHANFSVACLVLRPEAVGSNMPLQHVDITDSHLIESSFLRAELHARPWYFVMYLKLEVVRPGMVGNEQLTGVECRV